MSVNGNVVKKSLYFLNFSVGADGDGEKDSSGQLFPPMATPSVSKEPSPAPESTCSDPIQSPGSPEKSGTI